MPTSGLFVPADVSGGSARASGGSTTIDLNDGGYFDLNDGTRYTCASAGGCEIVDGTVTRGSVTGRVSGSGGGVTGDHGDDRATATGVEVGSDTEGVLESGDVDYFRVVIDAAGTLEAYTSSGIDTRGWLEDADGAEVGTNDDGGAGTNFRISEDVSPGTYYVRVEGYSSRVTGDYTLHVRFAESSADTSPRFPAGSGPGNQTYAVGAAISALTLPSASGGDGALTYSLSPDVPGLIFNATATVRRLTGTPTASGTYNMTYRVRDTDGDTDSLTFTITVTDSASEPDLAVESVSVSDGSPSAGASFTLRATVRNRGDGQSGSTTLRYYRSTNATISRNDTQVGTDSVNGLSASGTSAKSISLNAPSSGTYYYGACVDAVTGESDTDNNCSSGVRVAVADGASIPSHPSVTHRFSPSSYTIGQRVQLILDWNEVSGATSYEVEVDNFPIFFTRRPGRGCSVSGSVTTRETSYTHEFTASFLNDWYVVVQACNSEGCSCPP